MSNNARLVWYLVALILFLTACVIEVAQTRRVSPLALMSAGLAALTVVPLFDAIKAA